jgi:phenylalanyl-tRNA synthetase beta subunit
MKFLKSWLQDYIVETLPTDAVIIDALNRKAFEVEEVIAIEDDTVFDIKVLPNRAHDALGHHGMAYELCASLGLTFDTSKEVAENRDFYDSSIGAPLVAIDDAVACTRFMSMRIDHVSVEESPLWLKKRLEAIGQRSINNIVDITNYVQFALNKPMHAYDARSIKGTLRARFAHAGETLTTLDDKELTLDEKTLVIADDEKVLGLAGIKGGKWSGIKDDTTSIILESANFNPILIRKTAEGYGLRTDASKRFENGIANNLVIEGLHMTANLVHKLCGTAKRSEAVDVYPKKDAPYYVGISRDEINAILGSSYDDETIKATLTRLSFPYEILVPETYMKELYPTLLGAGYKNPTSMREDAPGAFSCSSLVSYLYKGVWMPSLSIDKYVFSKKITTEELQFGDLVFANSGEGVIRYESVEFLRGTKVKEGVDHVGIYIGDGKVIHATKVKGMVVMETIEEFSASRTIVGYGRILEDLSVPRYVVRVPSVRLDIRIKEDLAEEIGRIIGYDTLKPVLPEIKRQGLLHKRAHYEGKIRSILLKNGFSEIMTYTFGDTGEVELRKGLADDKEKLRNSLAKGLTEAFAKNLYNAPLLGQKQVKVFEIGNVFTKDTEIRSLGIMIDDGAKKTMFTETVEMVLSEVKRELGVDALSYETFSTKPYGITINLDTLFATLSEPTTYEVSLPSTNISVYKTLSPYPFIVRDIAVWTPVSTSWEDIHAFALQINDPRITRIDCFDTFTKTFEDGIQKTSYGIRLVIQSHEKTLTDDEANEVANVLYSLLKEKGFEIR